MVKMVKENGTLKVTSGYSADFVSGAKLLGGKWAADTKTWNFDERDEERVRNLLQTIYGENGAPCERVTVQIECTEEWLEKATSLSIYGKIIARGYGRDSGAKLGDGVILVSGKIDTGGSQKNWTTYAAKGTIFEIKDVPLGAVKNNGIPSYLSVIIVGEKKIDEKDKKDALVEEKAKLLARLAEIELLLS